jgi:hypothetical protein
MKSDIINQFIDKLDNIYKTDLIYRTIVVCNDDISEYKKILENKDYSVYTVNTISNINYDDLDYRIILINNNILEDFLDNIISNKNHYFYTYITFTNDNDDIKDKIINKYEYYYEIIDKII